MFFLNRNKIDILKQTQENLKATQENNEMLKNFLIALNTVNEDSNKDKCEEKVLEERKGTIAYALNMCTVSVSQIIDYDDIAFLEYEYEAILNNLNLENFPKDEEFLRILKQLLDVITFFRIQEKEKALVEKEYQHQLKNAIWSAVPNMNVVVAGDIGSVLLSLASQVGIGYMNYRRKKADLSLQNEREQWELQKSAMEQFHGLQKELFDTAWRLADKYEFKDEYRLTQRQITQFNKILLDQDSLRRCERLEYVEQHFQAYPPFFYYYAHAANDVSRSDIYDEQTCKSYKQKAIDYYNRFLEFTEYNLLREDQLVASAALELFEVIEHREQRLDLIERAIQASGHAHDVEQICAIHYLGLRKFDEAISLLKHLFNEQYNYEINAQLLSKVYVYQMLSGIERAEYDYKEIQRRAPMINLFPMPTNLNVDQNALEDSFIKLQQRELKNNASTLFVQYIQNQDLQYKTLLDQRNNISKEMQYYLNKVLREVGVFGIIANTFKDSLYQIIQKLNPEFTNMLSCYNEYGQRAPYIKFEEVFKAPILSFVKTFSDVVDSINNQQAISELEHMLFEFKTIANLSEINPNESKECIEFDFLDHTGLELEKHMMQVLKKEKYQEKNILHSQDRIYFYKKGEANYNSYMQRHSEINASINVLAIINDRKISDIDLLFTTQDLLYTRSNWNFSKKKHFKSIKYNNITASNKDNGVLLNTIAYSEPRVNMNCFLELCKELAHVHNQQYRDNWYYEVENILKVQ